MHVIMSKQYSLNLCYHPFGASLGRWSLWTDTQHTKHRPRCLEVFMDFFSANQLPGSFQIASFKILHGLQRTNKISTTQHLNRTVM